MKLECAHCGRPTGDQIPYCTRCADTLTTELHTVPGLVADMTVTHSRLDRLGRGRAGGKSADTPLPIRLDNGGNPGRGDTVLAALHEALEAPARTVCDQHGVRMNRRLVAEYVLESREHRRPDPAAFALIPATGTELAALYLAHHPHWIRQLPDPAEAHVDILDAINTARLYVDRLPPLAYRGPCETCGATLEAEQHASWVECGKCGSMYDSRRLREALLEQIRTWPASKADVLYVVHSLTGIDIPDGTFRSWISRLQLKPRAWIHNGQQVDYWIHRNDEPLYIVADALTLAQKDTAA